LQHVFAAIAALAVVVTAIATVAILMSGSDGTPEEASPPTSLAGRTGASAPDIGSGPGSTSSSPAGIPLGRDLAPSETEDCHSPGFAEGSAWQFADVQIAGDRHGGSYFCALHAGGAGGLQFVLGKSYAQLHVMIGFADDSSSLQHSVRFEVIGDGRTYLAEPTILRFGETEALRVDVRGVSRLEMKVTEVAKPTGSDSASKPVWGTPILLRR
jgi:hypothetical protein